MYITCYACNVTLTSKWCVLARCTTMAL